MKRLKWIAISLIILVIVVVGVVVLRIDSIVKSVVETQATDSLGLQTQLESASVSLLGSSVKLSGLQVSSPKGFNAPQMVSLGGIKVGATLKQLRGDPIAVQEIIIDKPMLVIEQANGKLNFKVLAEQQSKKAPDSGKPGDGTRDESEPVRLVIHDLAVNDAQVSLRPGIPGLSKEINIAIPSFVMKEIGNAEGNQNGAAIKEVVALMVSTLAQKASESKDLPPEVQQLLSLNAEQVKARIAGEVNKKIGEVGAEIGKKLGVEAGKAQDALQRGIGGLLGRDNAAPATRPR